MGLLDSDYNAVMSGRVKRSGLLYPPEDIAANAKNNASLLADFLPVIGGAKGTYEELKAGNPGMAALNAATIPLDLIPGAGTAAKLGLVGMFAGKGAKTFDALKAAKAEKMIADGVDRAKVWQETGYGHAPWQRGAIKHEIDDSNAVFNIGKLGNFPGVPYGQQGLVSDALKHKKLSSAYPDLSNIELTITPKDFGQNTSAAYMASGKVIPENINMVRQSKGQMIEDARSEAASVMDMANDPDELSFLINNFGSKEAADRWASQSASEYNRKADLIKSGFAPDRGAKSDALHELQHAIQQREGWARGGSQDAMKAERLNALADMEYAQNKLLPMENHAGAEASSMVLDGVTPEKLNEWLDVAAKRSGMSVDEMRALYNDPQELAYDAASEYMKAQNSSIDSYYKQIEQNRQKLREIGNDPYDAYRRLAGEAEARLTQYRMNLSPEERLAQYPYDPEYFKKATGVDIDKLIVRGLLGE